MCVSLIRHLGCFLIICITFLSVESFATDIIVNPSVSQTKVSQNTLRAIFGMRLLQWPDGEPIVVFVLSQSDPLHVNFTKEHLGLFPHQLERSWDLLVFSGTGQSPNRVKSEQEMRRHVAATPGAIGYISRTGFDESVRLLPIH